MSTAEVTPTLVIEAPIRESDLETDESETDEEFYDKAPHKIAKKLQEEKRLQMLAVAGPNSETVPMTIPNGKTYLLSFYYKHKPWFGLGTPKPLRNTMSYIFFT